VVRWNSWSVGLSGFIREGLSGVCSANLGDWERGWFDRRHFWISSEIGLRKCRWGVEEIGLNGEELRLGEGLRCLEP
jgi:hypothetical protein